MAPLGSLSVTWGIRVWYSSRAMYLEDPDDTPHPAATAPRYRPSPQYAPYQAQHAQASQYAYPMAEQVMQSGLLPHAMPYVMMPPQQPCMCPPNQTYGQYPSFGGMPPPKASSFVSPTTALLSVILAWWALSKDDPKPETK